MEHHQVPLWMGPLVALFGIVGILTRRSAQDFSAWFIARLLGRQQANRYYDRMIHGGWSDASVLSGAIAVLFGVILTVVSIKQL